MTFRLKARMISKYSIVLLAIFILISSFSIGALAQNVGYVSLTKVTASHPNTEKINQLNQELRTELQTRQIKLNEEGKGMEETELKKLEEKFNTEWDPIKQKILSQMQALQAERNSDILQAIKAIGEQGKYLVIINSEVPVFTGSDLNEYPIILYGGENLTQDVIAEVQKIASSK
ncbi:MAG: OmpH family outer membrane protein [Atribacterota bacterium]|jgi:Skp family chaperone for outer membrane proteins|nr:OmpH family outer membrane protein [Atribacterota bacterium]MDY0382409.1 OmpH family outer membrane protein [Atribacterota bacterium]